MILAATNYELATNMTNEALHAVYLDSSYSIFTYLLIRNSYQPKARNFLVIQT